jgi:hypothetical protein
MGLRKKKTLLDQAEEYVDAARPHVEAALEGARDFVQDTAIPALHEAKEKAAPTIADAREKAAPIIASGAAIAAERATAAKEAADERVEALKPRKKKSKLKRFLLFGAIAGAVAVIARKIQSGASGDNWQSSYTPSPPPSPPSPPSDDQGGASPEEALSDAAEEPHPSTTPENPADVVDLDEDQK